MEFSLNREAGRRFAITVAAIESICLIDTPPPLSSGTLFPRPRQNHDSAPSKRRCRYLMINRFPRRSAMKPLLAILLSLILVTSVHALIMLHKANDPTEDHDWPSGA